LLLYIRHLRYLVSRPMLVLACGFGRRKVLACLLLTLFLLTIGFSVKICIQQSSEVYVYAFLGSPDAERILTFLKGKSGWRVLFYDLNDSSSSSATFLNIVARLEVHGVEVLPTGLCIPCEMQDLAWDEIRIRYSSPLAIFLASGRLSAITVGTTDEEILDQASNVRADGVKVLAHYNVYTLTDESVRDELEGFLVGREDSGNRMEALSLISSIVFLALADSVDPCTLAIFTALLLIALRSFSRMRTATTGFSFVLAVFTGYYILGAGLVQILAAVPNIHRVVAVIGLAIGALSVADGLGPRFRSPIPESIGKFTEQRIHKSYGSTVASFALGLFTAFTLLPCSGGPYLACLGLISGLGEPIQAHFLLALYNIIFAVPLIVVLISLLAFSGLSRKVKAIGSTKLGLMEIAGGCLLAAACTWILLS